ncbi:ABC transporter permease subunit [Oceanobacillus jordanicus]|uniref:ABC transporter permease subunit n=1 Tax=Oceanobacillus jordanicus TaxID=2867266 RepID=A0AAW5BF56_9BACI|nr:ABC transporter permease subunit [Oceanobacillus jordanicus]MCG3421046.1 ABC transporter permease subunit [Oceanobacillus jordanicus]
MKDLLLFEFKKITKILYFMMMLLALIAFVSFFFIYSYVHTARVDDYIYNNEAIKSSHQLSIDELSNTEEDRATNKEDIKFFRGEMEEIDMLSESARNHDWENIIRYEIASSEETVKVLPSQSEENVYTWPTHFTNEVVMEKNKWLLEHHIKPVLPIHSFSEITAYDRVFNTAIDEQIAYEFFNKYDSSSIYFLFLLVENGLTIGGAIFFLFLFGSMITREGLGRNGPIHFLATMPLKRWKIIWSKLITTILLTFFVLFATILWGTLLGIVFDRFGDWGYPVLIYEPDFSFRFIEMGNFILLSLLLFLSLLIFCYSWLFLYSVLLKQTFMTIVLTIITVGSGYLLSGSDIAITQELAPFNPFHYFHITEVITMEYAFNAENYNFTMWNGIISLFIFSLIIILVAFLLFRRKAK